MADYEPLLIRAVSGLAEQSSDARRSVYDRARKALTTLLDRENPITNGSEFSAEVIALEQAIICVEARFSQPKAEPAANLFDERRRLAHNAAAGGIAGLVKVGVQLLLLPVMARLLGPAEFGLYALALPTVAFFTVLADGGLGASLAREDETVTSVWSTAFWALLASCTLIAVGTTIGGFVLAKLSHQPHVAGIMAFLSISFPLLAISALPAARLVRRGNLMVHSIGDLVSTLIGAATAVLLALLGAGAWALAVQYVLGFVVRAAFLNAAAFEWPTWEFRIAALLPHAATGGSLIGSRLSEFAGRLVENLLFGRLFGPAALGTYTFANQTSRFLCEAASNPLWSALYSHALREDARKIEPLHTKLSRLLASVLFPASALLTAAAPQIFDVILGRRWADAAILVQILVPFYALNAVAAQCGAIMLANGRNAALFWTLTGLSTGRILAVPFGALLGTMGVAWGVAAANIAYAAAMMVALTASTASPAWTLLRELLPPIIASVAAGLICRALIGVQPESLVWTSVSVGLGGCAFLVCLVVLQGRRLLADAFALRRIVFSRT